MDIFNSQPGIVSVIGDQRVLPGRIRILDPRFPSGNVPILISGIDYNQTTNQQFQTTLDGSVFIYVFGDRMGDIVVNGVAFKAMCNNSGKSGIEEVIDYYRTNRASVTPRPIIVEVVGKRVSGFLTAMKIRDNVTAADSMAPVSEFSFAINSLPKEGST